MESFLKEYFYCRMTIKNALLETISPYLVDEVIKKYFYSKIGLTTTYKFLAEKRENQENLGDS